MCAQCIKRVLCVICAQCDVMSCVIYVQRDKRVFLSFVPNVLHIFFVSNVMYVFFVSYVPNVMYVLFVSYVLNVLHVSYMP